MVVFELELDEETASELAAEAAAFEFESETAYLHWLVEHRSVVFDTDDELRERLAAIESRLDELEAASLRTGREDEDDDSGGDGDEITDTFDRAFEEAVGADDEEVSEAVAGVEVTDDDD